VSYFLADNILS